MDPNGRISEGSASARAAWPALLLLLPAFAVAWPGPGSVVVDALRPELGGAGLLALASLPAILWAALLARPAGAGSGPAERALWCFAAVFALSLFLTPVTDTLEADRALLTLLATAALLRAARAGAAAAWVGRGLVLLSLALSLPAHWGVQPRLAGALGNSGATAESLLPGALVGLVLCARGRGAWRALGGLAAALAVAYVARVPVLAGAVVLVAALAALGARRTLSRAQLGAATVGLALVAALTLGLASVDPERGLTTRAARAGDEAAERAGSALGGVAVRAALARASLAMLADHPFLGVGPGQFRAAFPPYRDAEERESSRRAAGGSSAVAVETEVEHAHDDWLQGALDTGVPGGLLWLAFLALAARAGWRALAGEDAARAALGLGTLGVVANALLRAPLTFDPVAAAVFAVGLGTIDDAPDTHARASAPARGVAVLLAVLLIATAARASSLVRVGRALALEGAGPHDARRAAPGDERIARALEARPDCALARLLAARRAHARGSLDAAAAHWRALLERRPHQIEALIELGRLEAERGAFADGRALWERALALEPGRADVARNLTRLEFEDERPLAGLERLDALGADASPGWRTALTVRELLSGREDGGVRLLRRLRPELDATSPELLYAFSQELDDSPDAAPLASAALARAHTLWARGHLRRGDGATAVRSFRQALAPTRAVVPGGALDLRLELAAALALDGRVDEARAEVDAVDAQPGARRAWERLEATARARLERAGLGPAQ